MTRSVTNDDRGDQTRGGDGMPRNYLRACLLLILTDGPAHGYDMANHLATLGLSTVGKGGMYRTLRAMEDDGLVDSGWEHSQSGPLRRSYDLTPEGRTWLKAWAEAMRSGQEFAATYLRRYEAARRMLPAPRSSSSRTSPAA
ncbi:MAG: helix-turn-helix transcriptional regulator [Actinomycetota bacterium]|nr:helix-turn-helix transcriptional regulator [Actinomycetota bacterium]